MNIVECRTTKSVVSNATTGGATFLTMLNEDALGPEVVEVLSRIRAAAPAWRQRANAAEAAGSIARETAEDVSATGALQLLQPANFGGLEAGMVAHSYAMSVIGEACMSTAWCAGVWGAHNWMLAHATETTQQAVWGDDPTVRTSASILPTTPMQTDSDGNVMVLGRFNFTSGCDHAHWFGAGGLLDPDGTPNPVITFFPADHDLIDHDSWDVAGLAGTGSKDIVVAEPIVVPMDRTISYLDTVRRTTPGLDVNHSHIYRSPFRPAAALVLAGPSVGAARGAVARFVELSASKTGPAIAGRIAEAGALADAAESVLLQAACDLDHLGTLQAPTRVQAGRIYRDTALAVRLAAEAVDVVFAAAGGGSLRRNEPIQRAWRDASAARNHRVLSWDPAAEEFGSAMVEQQLNHTTP